MSVLLTHAYFLEEDVREQKIMRPYVPLGILYIAAYLDEKGIDNHVFDSTFSNKAKLCDHLLQHKPAIAGLYVNLMTKLNALAIIKFIKLHLPDTFIVLGGPEVTHNAENFLNEGADCIVMGEGEQTMFEVVSQRLSGKGTLHDIAGAAFMHNGQLIQTPEREKIKSLDDLPVPARHKIDLSRYLEVWKKHHGKNAISVSTMRGCPYTCKWCSRAVYGLSYRRRSAEKVADELAEVKAQYNPDSLWFVDDVFTISHKWLREFSEALKKRNIQIPYECITRADRMNEEVIQLLKDTGCFRVWIGAESGSQKVIDLMDRRVDVNKVRDMIRLTRQHGIEAGTFIMLGYPGETEHDIEETIHHLKESNPDHFTITVAYPIRGTDLYEEVEAIQTTKPEWTSGTDRDIDFKRTYSRRYYDFAVKRVINEVNYSKSRNGIPTLTSSRFKIKSIAAKMGMWWMRQVKSK